MCTIKVKTVIGIQGKQIGCLWLCCKMQYSKYDNTIVVVLKIYIFNLRLV